MSSSENIISSAADDSLERKGEQKIRKILKGLDKKTYTVFNDIAFENDLRSSQIDHVVVSKYGVAVIETINPQGRIHGDENASEWSEYLDGEETRFYSPFLKNRGHVAALSRILDIKAAKITPIVCIASDAEINSELAGKVVSYKDLPEALAKYSVPAFTDEKVEEICSLLKEKATANYQKKQAEEIKKKEKVKVNPDADLENNKKGFNFKPLLFLILAIALAVGVVMVTNKNWDTLQQETDKHNYSIMKKPTVGATYYGNDDTFRGGLSLTNITDREYSVSLYDINGKLAYTTYVDPNGSFTARAPEGTFVIRATTGEFYDDDNKLTGKIGKEFEVVGTRNFAADTVTNVIIDDTMIEIG